jgi:hypothetical protein
MADEYDSYQLRLEVLSPVAADSPFDSDTLWGRIFCALMEGTKDERALSEAWLAELRATGARFGFGWQPPLIVSEGFQCDRDNRPWLPVPLALRLKWEQEGEKKHGLSRKEIKKIDRVPFDLFLSLCEGKEPNLKDLRAVCAEAPRIVPSLQPHLAMDRLSGTGLDGMLYMMPLSVYRAGPEPLEASEVSRKARLEPPPRICFFLKTPKSVDSNLIASALKRVCNEGWGHAKSRGLGQIGFTPVEPWQPRKFDGTPDGFVSLSHFCPAAVDPTSGYWKIRPKHPVPAQFVDGQRIVLGEGKDWRVRSFLRITPGSSFKFGEGREIQEYYGRMVSGEELLSPSLPGDPGIFHYALAYPFPLLWPESAS